MTTIYQRLNYDTTGPANTAVIQYPSTVISQMNTMPSFMNNWQQSDVGNSNVGGYFQNPVASLTSQIRDTCNTIISVSSIAPELTTIIDTATVTANSAYNFLRHTDRLSGVEPIGIDSPPSLPHYQQAVNAGKIISYITFQSDGIQNNSPILGCFSSIFSANQLTSMYSTISGDPAEISNSIVTIPGVGDGSDTYSSNLSSGQISAIVSDLVKISNFMDNTRTADEQYFTRENDIINDYNTVKQFSTMGTTERDLVLNFIGSPKLLARLNDTANNQCTGYSPTIDNPKPYTGNAATFTANTIYVPQDRPTNNTTVPNLYTDNINVVGNNIIITSNANTTTTTTFDNGNTITIVVRDPNGNLLSNTTSTQTPNGMVILTNTDAKGNIKISYVEPNTSGYYLDCPDCNC